VKHFFPERGCVAETSRSRSVTNDALEESTRHDVRKCCGWSRTTQPRSEAGCSRNSTPRRKAAKTQPDFFLLRNQETKNQRKDFMVSWLPDEIVFGCAFAPLR
jgi:hypothetical protein